MSVGRVGWLVAGTVLAVSAGTAVVSGASSAAPPASGAASHCPAPSVAPAPRPSGPLVMPEDYRLQLLDTVWQDLSDGYIDPGMNGVDWQAVHADYAAKVMLTENAWEDYTILEQMVGLLGDPDTQFFSALALDAGAAQDPTYGGIGILLDTSSAGTPEQGLRVLYVFPGGPASAAGIVPRDRIIAVGSDPVPVRSWSGDPSVPASAWWSSHPDRNRGRSSCSVSASPPRTIPVASGSRALPVSATSGCSRCRAMICRAR